jgi:hypothetical protein
MNSEEFGNRPCGQRLKNDLPVVWINDVEAFGEDSQMGLPIHAKPEGPIEEQRLQGDGSMLRENKNIEKFAQ